MDTTKTGEGYICFQGKHCDTITFPLYTENGLWFYKTNPYKDYVLSTTNKQQPHTTALIKRLSAENLYELYHARFGHPGQKIMSQLHLHIDGLPHLTRPPMFQCQACMLAKTTKRAIPAKSHHKVSPLQPGPAVNSPNTPSTTAPTIQPGTQFHMDMGFVHGTKYQHKDEDGTTVTGLDG
jgi:hypothetical protein